MVAPAAPGGRAPPATAPVRRGARVRAERREPHCADRPLIGRRDLGHDAGVEVEDPRERLRVGRCVEPRRHGAGEQMCLRPVEVVHACRDHAARALVPAGEGSPYTDVTVREREQRLADAASCRIAARHPQSPTGRGFHDGQRANLPMAHLIDQELGYCSAVCRQRGCPLTTVERVVVREINVDSRRSTRALRAHARTPMSPASATTSTPDVETPWSQNAASACPRASPSSTVAISTRPCSAKMRGSEMPAPAAALLASCRSVDVLVDRP